MNIIPNTTCRRCHRQYPSFRSRCPYCGTKKVKAVRSPVPETDSTVPGTAAAKSAAESTSSQMMIGLVLLLAVLIVTIFMVSRGVGSDVKATEVIEKEQETLENQVTPVPPPTATPSPSPSPQPQVTSVSITSDVYPGFEYNGQGFWGPVGQSVSFNVSWFPREVQSIPEWSSSDESVATVDENGTITLVGSGEATVTVKITDDPNGMGTMPIHVN